MGPASITSASIFAPGVASANALASLTQLGCWLAQQSNDTAVALRGLLLDVDSIRHGPLQNRAAINFFLLAHAHGCQDFEGMCCMNLSAPSESISKSIANLKDRVNQFQVDEGWGWLNNLFKSWGITGWLKALLKTGLLILLVTVIIALCLPCLLGFLHRAQQKSSTDVFVTQIQRGGSMEGLDSWSAGSKTM